MGTCKIQVRLSDEVLAIPSDWLDMEDMPEFQDEEDAIAWVSKNGCEQLETTLGLEFRVVPEKVDVGKLAEQCLGKLMKIMWFRGEMPEEGKALEIIEQHIRKGMQS